MNPFEAICRKIGQMSLERRQLREQYEQLLPVLSSHHNPDAYTIRFARAWKKADSLQNRSELLQKQLKRELELLEAFVERGDRDILYTKLAMDSDA